MTSLNDILVSLYKGLPEREILESLQGKFKHFKYNLNTVKDAQGWTMLHWAVQNGYTRFAAYVLAMGHKKGLADQFGCTPLMLAAFNGEMDMVRLLISGNALDEDVIEFCAECHKKHVDPTLGSEVESDVQLVQATRLDDELDRSFLLDTNGYGSTVIHYAAFRDQAKVVEAVLAVCPELVNAEDNHGDTALHHACAEGFNATIKVLLEHGGDANMRNRVFQNPLEKGIEARTLDADALNMLHGFHMENFPAIMSYPEIRHKMSQLQKEETSRKYEKRQKIKARTLLDLEDGNR